MIKMHEGLLLKIAIICSLIGVVGLYFVSGHIKIDEVSIDKLDYKEIGKSVKISGTIERVSDIGKVMFLEVGQEKVETVTVVLFKDSFIDLSKGDFVEISGEIEDYKGKREVIANSVVVK